MMLEKIKVYAFVGPSGTGKSYRAQMVAGDKDVHFIIDDGLLINENEVIQGDEFKDVIEQEREKSFLDKILNFVKDNALILLFGFIVLIVIIVFIVFRHYKRSALE